MLFKNISKILFCVFILGVSSVYSQTINFSASGLVGENINNPTSIDFGPNNKLYVAQQDGTIWEYDVTRDAAAPGLGTYSIVNTNSIDLIKNTTPNHNDDGTFNPLSSRQVTGLLATGTAANPILYITSSDSRIGGGGGAGNDSNLDTNSGILHRLTWNGSSWDKVDLVRGLPRCEENHSTNGLELFTDGGSTYLFIQQGGNTNMGAPSNNFAGSSEFYLAGALLKINLTQLQQMESANGGPYIDTRNGSTPYLYDLPTLNDPERADITNTHPSFPYGPSHPLYNATIDLGDPFGGNNGLNQAFPENGGPVQIFSPGYRNAYDILVTSSGQIYTVDNGSNGGWGGAPLIYDSNDQLKGTHWTSTYNPVAGDYVTNEFNIENGRTIGDALHYVGLITDPNNTYYGGHPVPIRAFPSRAGVYNYEYNGSTWVEAGAYTWENLITGVSGYFNSAFSIGDFSEDDRQGEYLAGNETSSKVNIFDVVNSSTNGMCEYTASNFDSALQGDILTASFNGNINRYELNASGDGLINQNNAFLSGFGNIPLDIIALGDSSPFPGTIWAATYGADNITVFEPVDFGECLQPGDAGFDPLGDYDVDGFTNQDEIDNGTNHCSAGSSPNDNDGDLISDLNDPDDDNDGIPDLQDVYAIDANNGTNTNLPVIYPFWNNDPGTGFFGLGFTGLMLDPNGNTDYLDQYNEDNLSFGGAGGKATVDEISSGDALGGQNSQENAFQFGVNVNTNSPPFTVHSKIETPFNGSQPLASQNYGMYIGNGDQNNYLKVVIMDGLVSGDATDGMEVLMEENGVTTSTKYDIPGLIQAGGVDIYISVNPQNNTAQPFYSLNDGEDISILGSPLTLPTSFLNTPNTGMAVGLIGTSGSSGSPYIATWDFINITEDQVSDLVASPPSIDFGSIDINSSPAQLNLTITNVGGPAQGPISITALNFTGPDANLFNSGLSLPLTVGSGAERLIPVSLTPDGNPGTKSASLEITHSGDNSPLIVPLSALLSDPTAYEPLVRISAAGNSVVPATDQGPDWEDNPVSGPYTGTSYAVNTGNNGPGFFQYANRHSSIPDYIDPATFSGIFGRERSDPASGEEMEFTVPLPNGNYIVNLYMGNSWVGSSQPGQRVFDILLEGNLVEDNMDLVVSFGHQVAGMKSYPVTVSDGVLNIAFDHEVENPLVNAIEILGEVITGNQPPVAVASATPLSGEAPLEVTFTGSASTDDAGISEYLWDFGDGNTATTPDPVHTYNTIDSYTVTLTVTDAEGLQDTEQLTIDVTPDLPPALIANPAALDFGTQPINAAAISLNMDLFNNGSVGEDISISAIAITGTDAALFSHSQTLPLDVVAQNSLIIPVNFTPDGNPGTKSASLEITHSGDNSPLIIPLDALLNDPTAIEPVVRISAAGNSVVPATDQGPDWEDNPVSGPYTGTSYAVNTGNNGSAFFQYANRHSSIPDYIDPATFSGIFGRERSDPAAGEEMEFTVPLPNGNYIVNLYMGNSWVGSSQPGQRVFDILLEGNLVEDNMDLVVSFGHQVAGMKSYPVTVSDGVLNIAFDHEVENPLVNAIEILGEVITGNQPPVAVASATPLSGEAPLEVTFTGSASTDDAGISEYLWDFGDGNTATTPDPVHTYTTVDSYTVTLTVTDAEGLQDTEQLTIDVTPDLPPALVANPAALDFGTQPINAAATQLNLDLFNNGSVGEDISISAIAITGTDAALFSHSETLPLDVVAQNSLIIPVNFTPDGNPGTKSAALEITHSGDNSPLIIPLDALLNDPTAIEPVVRISAAGNSVVPATDQGPDWEDNPVSGPYTGTSYAVNTGNNGPGFFQYANRHSSIPDYIDPATFSGIFGRERSDPASGEEMEFTVPLPNGNYIVNLFMGNSWVGSSQPGQRVFDILLEGNLVEDNMDLVVSFGHKVAGMKSYPVTVSDGVLNITFNHEVENPLVNAIEIMAITGNQPPVAVASATPLSGEAPLEVTFTGSTSTDDAGITEYLWDFGDGNTATTADPVYTYNAEGNYTVSLTVTDAEGLQDTEQLTIDVTPDLPPALVANPAALDFGTQPINAAATSLNMDLFNNGSVGEDISISAIAITGTDAALFSHSQTLPLDVVAQNSLIIPVDFTPDGNPGTKSASLEITHSGDNSPLIIPLDAVTEDYPPLTLDDISDQFNLVGESNSLVIFASGGDPNENVTYSIIDQPDGISIEPTNGQLIGTVDPSALNGGPNNDGVHLVAVTASKPGSTDDTEQFTWVITEDSSEVWNDKVENENYTARHECSFVQAGDKFYLFGGRENAQTLDIYDYTTDTWNSLVNSAPIEFNHFQAVEYQGLIWVIGAFKTNNFPTEVPADFIWAFNPGTQEWIQGPEIPSNRKRGSAGLVVYNDKFYVLAGNTIGHDGGYVNWFDEYDPATGIWTELADAPRPRDHFHAAVINGKLYAASGRLSGGPGGVFGPVIPEVDVYDFNSQSWSTLPTAQNIPTPRAASVVANFENKLIVAGGESLASTSTLSATEIYNPVTQSWETGADMIHPRHGTQGIVSGNGLYVVAGSPNRGGGNQLNMEYFGSDTATGTPSVASTLSSSANINFAIGETKDVFLSVSGGNIGIVVTSLELTGPDASEFSIDGGDLSNGLIKSNEQHTLNISHNGTEDNKNATLVVNFNNSDVLNIALTLGSGANQAPTAVASATPLSGIVPLSVAFTGSNSTDDVSIVSYLWDFKDGNTSNIADPNHTFTGVGTFNVELTVTDDVGLTDVATVNITVDPELVNQPPTAVATATPLSGDFPLNVSFIGSNSTDDGTIVSYTWDFGDGNGSALADPSHTYTNPGVFSASLTITDDGGLTDIITVDITVTDPTVNLPPEAVVSATPTVGLAPLDVSFTGSNSTDDTGVVSYFWDFGDGNTSSLADPVHTYANPGNYTATLTVTDDEALQDQASINITVNDASTQGVIGFTLINANANTELFDLFDGMQIDIADIQGIGLNIRANTNPNPVGSVGLSISGPLNNSRTESVAPYALYGDAGGNYNSQNFPLGTYTLTATAYSGAGLGGSVIGTAFTIQFTIEEDLGGTNQPPTAVATATPLSGDFPLNVSFIGSNSTDDGTIVSYTWDFGDGNGSALADPSHTYTNPGVFSASLTITDDGGLTDIITVDITVTDPTVNLPPEAVVSATPTVGLAPLDVSFTGSNSTDDTGVVSYFWDFGDGNTSSLADPVHTYANPGNYTATLTVTDDEALQDQASINITVNDASTQGVIGFTLINANANTELFDLFDGMQIDIADIQGIGLNIRANTNPNPVGSVGLSISGPLNNTRTESVAPYALYGDAGGNYNSQNFPLGTYTLTATAYSGAGLGGSVIGNNYTIKFSIVDLSGASSRPSEDDIEAMENQNTVMDQTDLSLISLHPNPADKEVYIEIPSHISIVGDVYIFSPDGRLVRKHTINSNSSLDEIPTYDLEEGFYILNVPLKNGSVYRGKMIIRH